MVARDPQPARLDDRALRRVIDKANSDLGAGIGILEGTAGAPYVAFLYPQGDTYFTRPSAAAGRAPPCSGPGRRPPPLAAFPHAMDPGGPRALEPPRRKPEGRRSAPPIGEHCAEEIYYRINGDRLMETIILASGSPRRKELLTRVKMPFKVIPPNITEDYSLDAARGAVSPACPQQGRGGDGAVQVRVSAVGSRGGHHRGDRRQKSSASRRAPMRRRRCSAFFQGGCTGSYSGIAVLVERGKPIDSEVVRTEVKFRAILPAEMRYYVDCGEWSGAAGAYRIQERGAFFVEWIQGSYSNVVGLPLEAFYGILRRNAYDF